MNRADIIARTIWLKQLAAAALDARKVLVGQLTDEAREEFDKNGPATWRPKGIATIPFSVSNDAIEVTDEAKFLDWVARRNPTEIETSVRQSWRTYVLEKLARIAEDDVICLDDGEVIPGVSLRKGGEFIGISITPTPQARVAFTAVANATMLELVARAEVDAVSAVPALLAEVARD